MKFLVALTIESEAQSKSLLINEFVNSINEFIQKKLYGGGICQFLIDLYIINPPIGYEHLHKNFKPKYIEYKLLTNRLTGEKLEIKKQFSYSIRIDGDNYFNFVKASKIESEKTLATEILKSLSNFEKSLRKVNDFDDNQFKADLEGFFREQNII